VPTTPTQIENAEKIVKTSRAWLLDFGKGFRAVVGAHEMSQVILEPPLFYVPCAPPYCNEVLTLRDRIIPVLDVPTLLTGQEDTPPRYVVGIGAYQTAPTQPIHYGGLYLAITPLPITVSDNQACVLPSKYAYWKPYVLSCFLYLGAEVPILDLGKLFHANQN